MTTCSEVMTASPTFCLPDHTASYVARIMRDEDIGSVPIIENLNTRKLVGIVTDRDLTLKVIAENRDGQSVTLNEVMSRHPVTCRENEDIDRAMQAMADHQVRRIPIVNERNELVGIIAQADIATRTEQPRKTAAVVEDISKPNG